MESFGVTAPPMGRQMLSSIQEKCECEKECVCDEVVECVTDSEENQVPLCNCDECQNRPTADPTLCLFRLFPNDVCACCGNSTAKTWCLTKDACSRGCYDFLVDEGVITLRSNKKKSAMRDVVIDNDFVPFCGEPLEKDFDFEDDELDDMFNDLLRPII